MSRSFVSLTARDLSVAIDARLLLADVELVIATGTRLGLVGPNGSGKSTLLRTLAGLHPPDAGQLLPSPRSLTIGYLPQEAAPARGETGQELLARRTGVAVAQRELDLATLALAGSATSDSDADPADHYAAALDRWMGLGAADLEARSATVLDDLGLSHSVLDQDVTCLSGGQAARLQLAALLLSRFDVFLLDEPTNNLDVAGLDRLERFVASIEGPVVVVSHDRAFLDGVVTAVAEIDIHSRTLTRYEGGWHTYLDERERSRRQAEGAYQAYVEQKDHLLRQVRRQDEWSAQGVRAAKRSGERDKHIRHKHAQGAQQMAGQARKTKDELARLDQVDKPRDTWDLRLRIADAGRSGDEVASLTGAVVERPGGAGLTSDDGSSTPGFRLGPVDLHLTRGERVALVGANGAGKSTLLQALLGRLPLVAGEQHLGASVVVGEIRQRDQDGEAALGRGLFTRSATLLDSFMQETGMTVAASARSALAKFGLGAEHVVRRLTSLSPGERTRATLATLQSRGVNLLVLDEPTNHLDMAAIEQLELAVAAYEGTLVLVTHDRRLLDAVSCERTIEVSNGQVHQH